MSDGLDMLYQAITDRIIDDLEHDRLPWQRLHRLRDHSPEVFFLQPGEWSLCAEISSYFLTAELGLPAPRHHRPPEEIAKWLKILRNDPRAIIRIAQAAWKTTNYALTLLPESHSTPADLVNPPEPQKTPEVTPFSEKVTTFPC